MPKKIIMGLALASLGLTTNVHSIGFADGVVSYNAGTGGAAGYNNPSSALGEPSRVTPGQFGGPVDPFSPPYLSEQLVAIGAGGSLTLQFNGGIANHPSNPYGLDFLVFGNSGFTIINGDFGGGGITDGTLFGANTGETRVSVSNDGQNYYELTPSLAPVFDGLLPTDGSGDFHSPADPSLKGPAFNNQGLPGIRQLYRGSAGGTGYDISWARDGQGQAVTLDSIQYVRLDVLSGVSEIDGLAVVPEPSVVVLLLGGIGVFGFWRNRRKA